MFPPQNQSKLNKLNSKPREGEGPEPLWGASAGWHCPPLWAAHPLMGYSCKVCSLWFKLEMTWRKMLLGRECEVRWRSPAWFPGVYPAHLSCLATGQEAIAMTSLRMEPFLGFSRMLEASKGLKTTSAGTALAVQWQRLCVPNAGDTGSIPGQGARYHML